VTVQRIVDIFSFASTSDAVRRTSIKSNLLAANIRTPAPSTTPAALVTRHAAGTPDPWQMDAMLAKELIPNDQYSSPMKYTYASATPPRAPTRRRRRAL
jgi:hypothetical protein